jgi:sulfatase modifying factor 1
MNDEKDEPKNDDWGMTMPHLRLEKDKNADDFSRDFAPRIKPNAQQTSSSDDWGMNVQNLNSPNNQTAHTDFDKTTPNINIAKNVWEDETPPSVSQPPANDWEMMVPNINLSPETKPPPTPSDDWGATAQNINVSPENKAADDWGMTVPNLNAPKREKQDNWSMPDPVFRISDGEKLDDVAKRTMYPISPSEIGNFDKTTPNFNLSGVSSAREETSTTRSAPHLDLQSQPSVSEQFTAAEKSEEVKQSAKSDNSKIFFIIGGLFTMLLLAGIFLAGIYILFFNKPATAVKTEPIKEEQTESDTLKTAAPVVSAEETTLPKEIEYKGAMVLIAAGEFSMGSDTGADESKPAHKVVLPAFYIDKTEVTNRQYKAFCDATGKSYPPSSHLEKDYFLSRPNAPVVGVSFNDARAYAAWAGKRLPTEEEWEKAASWDATANVKREFPWGNDFQKTNAAFGISKIADVGKYTAGASPSGALDMAGNVLEWVDAFFQPYPNGAAKNPEFGEKNRVVRGGHFNSKSTDSLKTTKRIYVSPDIASGEDDEKLIAAIIGFRCAVSANDSRVADALREQGK